MVYVLTADQCACGACQGGHRVPEGYFGGSVCMCRCHRLEGAERDAFIAERHKALQEAVNELVAKKKQPELPPDYSAFTTTAEQLLKQCRDDAAKRRHAKAAAEALELARCAIQLSRALSRMAGEA